MYDIDRKTASRILKVSIRTVDRYIHANRLSTEERDGRIWLDKSQVLKIRGVRKVLPVEVPGIDEVSIDNTVSTGVDNSVDSVHIVSIHSPSNQKESTSEGLHQENENSRQNGHGKDEEVYQKLFQELREELKTKQERLEGANYRVGHLEAMLKETIPLPEHQKLLQMEQGRLLELRQTFDPLQQQTLQLNEKLKEEKLNKRIYLIILFIIMLLQPLWLVLAIYKK
jgi:hypothetical protein